MSIEPGTEMRGILPPHRSPRKSSIMHKVGRGFAVALFSALAVLIVSIFLGARAAARKAVCRAYVNQLSLALSMYAADYSDRMPPAPIWSDCLNNYTKNLGIYRCPARPSSPGGFAFNRLLSTRPLEELNSGSLSPAIFESSIGTLNASDELQSFITPHNGKGNVIFSTGQIQSVSISPSASAGIRKPKPTRRANQQ